MLSTTMHSNTNSTCYLRSECRTEADREQGALGTGPLCFIMGGVAWRSDVALGSFSCSAASSCLRIPASNGVVQLLSASRVRTLEGMGHQPIRCHIRATHQDGDNHAGQEGEGRNRSDRP